MSSQMQTARNRLDFFDALPVGAELERVRQRANARLGSGIKTQTVRKMLAKLEIDKDQQ